LDIVLLTAFAFLAGFVDAVAGGGGLIQVPALFAVAPGAQPVTLLGTNKFVSIMGTSMAVRQYMRRVTLPWHALGPAALVALVSSLAGAWTVTQISPDFLRPLVLVLLVLVAIYTFWNKGLGEIHAPHPSRRVEFWALMLMGALIGFYDGFFGPGTGSFFIFLLVRYLGYDFLHASGSSKVLNAATNLGALLLFAATGNVWYLAAIPMACANIIGGYLGSHMAIKKGSGFVRGFFLLVLVALIAKMSYDIFLR
jgi:uncharacterized membrane protein YfcA